VILKSSAFFMRSIKLKKIFYVEEETCFYILPGAGLGFKVR